MKASLSLDLDNKWSYMKTHGDAAWETLPSYLPIVLPRVFDFLDRLDLRITFFIVGEDAERPENADVLSEIAKRGHEVGNHSHHHEPWMHRRSKAAIDAEFAKSEEAIQRVTGVRPLGFRGPGFAHSDAILEVLVQRGYVYDASSLPTYIGPLARAYFFRSTKLSRAERAARADLFGRFADGFRPNRQHRIEVPTGSLAEIPVTTFPLLRLPIHISYVLYIATVSPALALGYFKTALLACRLTGTEPSILLHPLDFLGAAECPELKFFPAMELDPEIKRDIVRESIGCLSKRFDVRPIKEIVDSQRTLLIEDVGKVA
jgi:peptidoglycan-N-acetylglucosamine deacetylase